MKLIEKMFKGKLYLTKQGLCALAGAGIILVTSGCGAKENKNEVDDVNKAAYTQVERTKLSASNFDVEVKNIEEALSEKGLDVRPELIKSTLMVLNQRYFTEEDFKALCDDGFNYLDEVENTLALASMITTHNNKADLDKQIEYAQFSYDDFDYQLLHQLDNYSLELVEAVRNDSKDVDKVIDDTLVKVEPFIVREEGIEVGDKEYSKRNLKPGADLWSEFVAIQMANEIHTYNNLEVSEVIDALVKSDIKEPTDELIKLRNNLHTTLNNKERAGKFYTTFKDYSKDEQYTKEQKEQLEQLTTCIGREILLQNIQNGCKGTTSISHIINYDMSCLEEKTK